MHQLSSIVPLPRPGMTRGVQLGATETLEANLANITLKKLDLEFDVDPLFHKVRPRHVRLDPLPSNKLVYNAAHRAGSAGSGGGGA